MQNKHLPVALQSAVGSAAVHLVTHLYSGMSTITRNYGYRSLGVIESAYLLDEMDVEMISDGCHMPPELLRLKDFQGAAPFAELHHEVRIGDDPQGEERTAVFFLAQEDLARVEREVPQISGLAGRRADLYENRRNVFRKM